MSANSNTRIETVDGTAWRFTPNGLPERGQRLQAIVLARLVDEISGEGLRAGALRLASPEMPDSMHARVTDGGGLGWVGVPMRVFPQLALTPATLDMQIQLNGYLPLTLQALLPAQPGFPAHFVPLDLGTLPMRRRAVALQGQVMRRGLPQPTPMPGALVQLDGLWPQAPGPSVSLAASMQPALCVGLQPALNGAWPIGSVVQGCSEVPDLAQAKRLLASVPAGSTTLPLSSRSGVFVAEPLWIDSDDPGRSEVIATAAVPGGLSADQPCQVRLLHPTRHLHRAGARVMPLSAAPAGAPRTLTRAAGDADELLFLNAAPTWPTGTLLRLANGVAPMAYTRAQPMQSTADAQGFWQLPPLSRVALVQLLVTPAPPPAPAVAPPPLRVIVTLQFGSKDQRLVLAFE